MEGRLTKQFINNLEPKKEKYYVSDGNSLFIRVYPNGAKTWIVKYTNDQKKRKEISIGVFPDMSPDDARKKARKMLSDETLKNESYHLTLEQVCSRYIDSKTDITQKTKDNKMLYMGYLGKLLPVEINELTRVDFSRYLNGLLDTRTNDTCRRVCGFIGEVYEYAYNQGYIKSTEIGMNLVSCLPKKEAGNHFAAVIDNDGIGRLMEAIELAPTHYKTARQWGDGDLTIQRAIKFIAYTTARLNTVLLARWKEIDFENKIWHAPAEHMKTKKPHDFPLPKQAIKILDGLLANPNLDYEDGEGIIFDIQFKTSKSYDAKKQCLDKAMRALQDLPENIRPEKHTLHGFRAMASSVLNQSGKWNPDAIEFQLSHVHKDKIRAAYNRANYWDERVEMMQWYADVIDAISITG